MLAKINSSALYGVDAFTISVEVSVTNGLGSMIIGLPDDSIKESLSRISVAVSSIGFQMPRTKLVVNLAPANVKKMGTAFDLPIALGILLATGQITDMDKLAQYLVIGEIGLDGGVFPVRGALCMTCQAKKDGFKGIILPKYNVAEAALVEGIDVYGIEHMKQVLDFIQSDCSLDPEKSQPLRQQKYKRGLDFRDIKGQYRVKRALEIAAAGGHNALLIGPPGNGKSMMAKALPSILPPMSAEESLETTRIHSVVSGQNNFYGLIQERPFRSPHHTTSDIALAGGGTIPVPGEISLAHNGVLFLDELPEFKRSVIEVLRQPLEDRKVLIARAKCSIEYPASFMFLAAMNPCACGYFGHPSRKCTCSRKSVFSYRRRVSGPVMERIDLQIETESVPVSEIMGQNEKAESSETISKRVCRARKIQSVRFQNLSGIYCNAQMPEKNIEEFCFLEQPARRFLLRQMDQNQFSLRSYTRILKVARTIADLKGTPQIELDHIAEAISFRSMDKPLLMPSLKKEETITRDILTGRFTGIARKY